MSTLNELIAQKNALEQQIAEMRHAEIAAAIAQIKSLINEHGLTSDDIFNTGKFKATKVKTNPAQAKYLDPVSGKTWSGRGINPKWIDGKNRADFLIVK